MTAPFQLFDALPSHIEDALRESIRRFGVLVPVVRDQDGNTIDGHHRSRLADELGVDYRVDVIKVADDDEAREIARTLNADRRHLPPEQRKEVVAHLREQGHSTRAIAEAVKVSQSQVVKDVRELNTSGQLNEPERIVGKDGKDRPARKPAVVSALNDRQARQVQKALETVDPPTDVSTAADVRREARDQAKRERVAQIESVSPPPLDSLDTFPLLYVDPPWRYERASTPNRAIENHYPTMDLDEICALDVPAADDAVLFMWATSPKLAEALTVVEAWGFTYRTCMVWVKDRIGMGYYARQRHELLLVAARGKGQVPHEAHRPDSVHEAPRGEHSAKPDLFYDLLEGMYPHLPKVELFARRQRDGWASWGNQAVAA